MIAFWYLLFFCWSVISLANPLVAPHLSESSTLAGIGRSEFRLVEIESLFLFSSLIHSSHSIPSLPSFLSPYLRPSPRAPTNVTTPLVPDATMSAFAVFPLLAYSTLLAIFSFISVRIARWRRKQRPAALTLGDDDGVELLPTNTSMLSPRFKGLPVPPPLPSLVPLPASPAPSHVNSRSQSFSNLQLLQSHHAVVDLLDRPKSPLHFGLSSPGPGPRFNKSKRSHSVGSASPLSPSKRRKEISAVRRPFISDPESSEMDDFTSQRHITATVSTPNTPFPPQTQFGTLVDLSVPPVSVSTHPTFQSPGHIWNFPPASISNVEVNLIDLHDPEKENMNLDTPEPESKPEPVPVLISELTEQDANNLDDDESDVGYEPDAENDNENTERKEIDIGWEWGFESVSSLSMTSHPIAPAEEQPLAIEEEDLVDGNGSPSTTLGEKDPFCPIPVTASSSSSSYIHPRQAEDFVVDPAEGIEPSDNGTLLSISRDDTSLDSDLIQRVYISDVDDECFELGPNNVFGDGDVLDDVQADSFFGDSSNVVGAVEIGVPAAMDVDAAGQIDGDDINDTNDFYENNDYREGLEDEDAELDLEKGVDAGVDAGVDVDIDEDVRDEIQAQVAAPPTSITSLSSSELTTPTATTFVAVDADSDSREVVTTPVPPTPPPSHERLAALAQDDVAIEEEALEEDPKEIVVPEEESEFPDPDLLPLPDIESENIAFTAAASTAESEPNSPKAAVDLVFSHTTHNQIPTPPASPPQQRRTLPRPLPAWSIRASDAPPLGLASSTSSPILHRSKSFVDMLSGENAILVAEKELKIDEKDGKAEERPETPVPKTAILPGAFPVENHPLADVMAAMEEDVKKKTAKETGSPSSSGAQETTTGTSTALEVVPATKATRRQPTRSPIDIALAMQLRPGLGLGADPAWMVRFLMAMFGWFVVLISGSAGDGYAKAPYVGIRRSTSTSG